MASKDAPIFVAAASGQLEAVKAALEQDAQLLHARASDGSTLVHLAVDGGHLPLLRHLAQCGAPLDALDNAGASPLMRAAAQGCPRSMGALLDLRADVNQRSPEGVTALHHAARSANPSAAVEWLLQHKAEVSGGQEQGGTVLQWAVSGGDLGAVVALLEAAPALLQAQDGHGRTALHTAAGHPSGAPLTLFLLERRAVPSAAATDGVTPLHVASEGGHVETVRHLLMFGAGVTADKEGRTPQDVGAKHPAVLTELKRPASGAYTWTVEQRLQNMEKFKAQGNKVFQAGEYSKSARFYTLAISFCPDNHVLFSNRSAAYYNLRRLPAALADALHCTALSPGWPKGYFRLGATLTLMERFEEARAALEKGLALDPKNADLKAALGELGKAARDAKA